MMGASSRPRDMAHAKRVGVASDRGRFLRVEDMVASTGLSESTIRRRVKAGEMPPSIALTTRCVGWWERDFETWVAERRSGQAANWPAENEI